MNFTSDGNVEHNFRPEYRPDIDGLRAFAVISVVLFHLYPHFLSGGFIGVDIFFVISGYLISTIIYRSLSSGKFDIMEFYVHRVRRIFPALTLVIATCVIVGRNLMLPTEYISLGRHVISSVLFIQNFNILSEIGYFDSDTLLKPLTHLWSLSIEEQFYLLFPLFCLASWRLRWNLFRAVLILLGLSLVANLVVTHQSATSAFFLPYTRFWELATGCAIAAAAITSRDVRYRKLLLRILDKGDAARTKRRLDDIFSCFALALLLVGVFLLNGSLSFPGAWALIPVCGAALMIWSGPHGLINRSILSHPLSTFVGRISYPLYLWHWPLLSFVTIADGHHPTSEQILGILASSIVLSWLTYRLVERPIRFGHLSPMRTTAVLVGAMALLGFFGRNVSYFVRTYDDNIMKVAQVWDFSDYPIPTNAKIENGEIHFGDNPHSRVVMIGDSHARQYRNVLANFYTQHTETRNPRYPEVVLSWLHDPVPPVITDKLLNDPSVKAVFLSYFWAIAYGSDQVDNLVRCCGKGLGGVIETQSPRMTPQQMDALDASLEGSIRALTAHGKKVYLILDNPYGHEFSPRTILKRDLWHGLTLDAPPVPLGQVLNRLEPSRSRLEALAKRAGAVTIDPLIDLCSESECDPLTADGEPMNKDYDHLSPLTNTKTIHFFDAILNDIAQGNK